MGQGRDPAAEARWEEGLMARELRYDRALLVVTLAMLAAGLVFILSSSGVLALRSKGDPNYFLVRQVIWASAGLAVMLAATKVNLDFLKRRKVVLGLVAIEVAMLCATLAMPKINGSHRWLRLGPLSAQPSETAKLVLIILAAYLLEKREREKRTWVQMGVPLGVVAGLMGLIILLQPDLGTVVVLGVITLAMLFAGGFPLRWLAIAAVGGALLLSMLMMMSSYRRARLMTYMNPEHDPKGAGFQIRQSLIAVGSGGVTGKWLGGGSQKLMFLPEPHSDFIYAMIGEELGMIGTFGVLGLFLAFGFLGLRAIQGAPDAFSGYMATGIVSWIFFQGIIHIYVTLAMAPAKGLPLPLMSYGGSSLVIGLCGVGLLLNVSQYRT
jgi:cell division protein FtsW